MGLSGYPYFTTQESNFNSSVNSITQYSPQQTDCAVPTNHGNKDLMRRGYRVCLVVKSICYSSRRHQLFS